MKSPRPLTGKHILLMLVAFFGVMIVANAIFVTLAVKSFPGESQKKSYMQGLQYNDVLAERAAQMALGWRVEIIRIDQVDDAATIELRFFDADDKPLTGLVIDSDIKRPVHDEEDRRLTFEEMGLGRYVARTRPLAPGAWDLSAAAIAKSGARFEVRSRVQVP